MTTRLEMSMITVHGTLDTMVFMTEGQHSFQTMKADMEETLSVNGIPIDILVASLPGETTPEITDGYGFFLLCIVALTRSCSLSLSLSPSVFIRVLFPQWVHV